jgi:outer membrane protein assembly factor BamD
MRKILVILLVLFAAVAVLSSCGSEAKLRKRMNNYVKKGTIEQKDSAAYFFYNNESYEKASFMFEELMSLRRGDPRSADYLYHFAYCKYNQKLFISSSFYFEQYTQQYPSGEKFEESAFMVAYSYYLQSDPHFLDQEYTNKALNQFQAFVNIFPGSEKVKEANEIMSDLRERLAKKAFEQAKLYLKVSNYKAAVEAFKNLVRQYPDSRYREEAQFLLVKASVELASVSVISKRKNRFLDAIDYYQTFIDRFPNSIFVKEAENLYQKAQRGLGKVVG